ncbi:GntR family transcriptional regulator [Chimaeribacter coloradensis]|uniref:GntR family transcriptional regulator n=1 Tax=Chimaeribacter coloradensis TaxID=2060068 RepID=A0A2N5E1G1_9GAMM|nr:FCD domain-containing protein [Chimaeribacter coloradensis]PLR34139.1 GntR family transcriptional regulator [Chimaeribacter coloradensis]
MNRTATAKQREVTRIVDILAQAIAQHRLRPGTRLVEAHIVEALNANRNHVQAALQRLAAHMSSEHAVIESSDRRAIVGTLSNFHLLLADVGGNAVLREILANLMVRSSLIVALYQRNAVPACASGEHQAILDALAGGDTASAVHAMLTHLDLLESQLDLSDTPTPTHTLQQALSGL